MTKKPKVGMYILLDINYRNTYWVKLAKITEVHKDNIYAFALEFTGTGSCPTSFRHSKTVCISNPMPNYYTLHKNIESVITKEL